MAGEFSMSPSAVAHDKVSLSRIQFSSGIQSHWGVFALSDAATMMDLEIHKVVSSVDRLEKSSVTVKRSSIMHIELTQLVATHR